MKFKNKRFYELTDDFQKVIVKVHYAYTKRCSKMIDPNSKVDYRIIDCYIPAEAKIDDDGYIQIMYKAIHNYDAYMTYFVYDKSNCPELFDFHEFDLRATLQMALGLLIGYDESDDCLKPFIDYTDENGKQFYRKWWMIDQFYNNARNLSGELLKDAKEFKNVSHF